MWGFLSSLLIVTCFGEDILLNSNCTEIINGECMGCYDGYILDKEDNTCYCECYTDNCKICPCAEEEGYLLECYECFDNYTLLSTDDQVSCVDCQDVTNQCLQCYNDEYGCELCNDGYVHSTSTNCVLKEQSVPYCSVFMEEEVGCETCEDGYVLASPYLCVKCSDFFTNCLSCNGTTCSECDDLWIYSEEKNDCIYNSAVMISIFSIFLLVGVLL
ncbi:Furin repeat-containing protein [Entamoeba marina]